MKQMCAAAIAVLCLVTLGWLPVAAQDMARPTQAVFGDVAPAVPASWVKKVRRNGVIEFSCPQPKCAEPGEIAYSAMVEPNDAEAELRAAVRQNRNVIREMGDKLSKASNGAMRQVAFKDMSDARMIRFERVFKKQDGRATEYYILYRTISGNQSRIASATAPTLAKARQYIKIGRASFPK